MSRNFDLLTQVEFEREVNIEDTRSRVSARPSAVKEVVPIPASRPCDARGQEILRLVQNIFLSTDGRAPRQVVICGVDGDGGSSSVCASVGRALAADCSRQVCLVDANVRSLQLSGIFGVDWTASLSSDSVCVHKHCLKIEDNLWVAGPSLLADTGRVLLPAYDLKERLVQLGETFEYVLIDAPGLSICGDAQLLGQVADAVILVIEANGTRRMTARKAKEALDAAGVRLLGTVLHNRSLPIPESIYKRL